MNGSSLVRYATEGRSGDGQKLYWARAGIDGAPFRGQYPPDLTEAEYDDRVVRVSEPQNGFFDVTDPKQNAKFLDVMGKIYNGWYQGVHIERFWRGTTQHYLEWNVYYMEDGKRTMTPYVGHVELSHGSRQGAGPPGPG
jgi:hypothetical protein